MLRFHYCMTNLKCCRSFVCIKGISFSFGQDLFAVFFGYFSFGGRKNKREWHRYQTVLFVSGCCTFTLCENKFRCGVYECRGASSAAHTCCCLWETRNTPSHFPLTSLLSSCLKKHASSQHIRTNLTELWVRCRSNQTVTPTNTHRCSFTPSFSTKPHRFLSAHWREWRFSLRKGLPMAAAFNGSPAALARGVLLTAEPRDSWQQPLLSHASS